MTDTRSETERAPWWAWGCTYLTPRDRKNVARFNLLALAWALSFVAARLLIESGMVASRPAVWAVAAAPLAVGIATVTAYVHFLRHADELLRQIHLEGLALGFGGGMLYEMGFRLLEEATGLPKMALSDPVLVMVVFWALGMMRATRRVQG
jgi:hypothetical protein